MPVPPTAQATGGRPVARMLGSAALALGVTWWIARSDVDDRDYQVPFTFTGKLEPLQLTPEEEKRLMQESRRSNRASE